MDRTVRLDDKKFILGGRFFSRKISLPYESTAPFSVSRKFICPKQINDTVRIFFTGDAVIKRVTAGKLALSPGEKINGCISYDVTAALKTGKTRITAEFEGGRAEGFYFDVKRTPTEK